MRILHRALIVLLTVAAVLARAQSVHWENDDSSPGMVVNLVFEDCAPDGQPELPSIPNVALTLSGQQTAMNVVNMTMTQTLTLQYVVQARRGGPLQIPAFTVKTNKGPIRVAAFNGSAPAISADSVASSKLIPERTTVWVGEVFGLTYELTAARRYNPQINQSFDWSPAPLVAEDWSKYDVTDTVENGQREAKLTYHTRAYAKTPNTLKLSAATHLIQVQTGSSSFGLFSQPRMEPVSVTSDQPTIQIRPLPAAPGGFSGAVGQFKLTSKVVPKEAGVGEPITWTLELTGTGNWPEIAGLPAREVSKDFQVIQPKAKRTTTEGKLFDATLTEDVVLVPTKSGTYTLGPVAFVFFNPQSGAYETLHTEQVTVTITPPAPSAGVAASAGNGAATAESTSQTPNSTRNPPTVPAEPAAIPRDPLPGRAESALPLTTSGLVAWLLSPIAGLLILWFGLAWRRAAKTDPLRAQREAHARLVALLTEMRKTQAMTTLAGSSANTSPLATPLLRWQHDTAILHRIPHAAPNADALEKEWARLWREAERTLYGANAPLPSDWFARAEAAVVAKRVPGFNPARIFLPKNLLAFAATMALLLAIGGTKLHAVTPAPDVQYRAGNFAAAEKVWRDVIAQHPTDWIARHNLSLALAQEDRVSEAAAQATSAFVQHPNDPSVRWNFAFTTDKAGFAPEPLHLFLREGPVLAVASLASPAVWQRILVLAAFGVAAALGWLLVNAYGRRSVRQSWAAFIAGALVTAVGIVAVFGLVSYGETADVRAVITAQGGVLRSIPTEADTTQKTSTLAPGTVAIADKSFLGNWDHLVFANGQTGWVRKEEVVPLWK